jgi:hypothetical protein
MTESQNQPLVLVQAISQTLNQFRNLSFSPDFLRVLSKYEGIESSINTEQSK